MFASLVRLKKNYVKFGYLVPVGTTYTFSIEAT